MSAFFSILATIMVGTLILGAPMSAFYNFYQGYRILNESQTKSEVIDRWDGGKSRRKKGQRHIRLGIIYAVIFIGFVGFILLLLWLAS